MLANSHSHRTPLVFRGSIRESRPPEGSSGGEPRRVRSGPPRETDTPARVSPLLDGIVPTARIPLQYLGLDKDRQRDAKYSAFQVLPAENRSEGSARAVALPSFLRLPYFPLRAILPLALLLLSGHPARIQGSSPESLSPRSRHPFEPIVRQVAMQRPRDTTVSASLPRMHRSRRSLPQRPRMRFQDNRKSRHR